MEDNSLDHSNRTLTVACTVGLCNRLKVLISGLALAEGSRRAFRMLWPRTPSCAAAFHELFSTPWDVVEAPEEMLSSFTNFSHGWMGGTIPDILEMTDEHLRIQAVSWLTLGHNFPRHRQLAERRFELFKELQPLPELAGQIAKFKKAHFRPEMIGVHLRRGDFVPYRPDLSGNTHRAMRAVDEFLLQSPAAGILLCSDDGAVEPFFESRPPAVEGVRDKFIKRYGNRVVWTEPRTLDRRKSTAIQDAVIDLWLLRETNAFVGTQGSTFSELAVYGRNVPASQCGGPTLGYALMRGALRFTGLLYLLRFVLCRHRAVRKAPLPILLTYCRTQAWNKLFSWKKCLQRPAQSRNDLRN